MLKNDLKQLSCIYINNASKYYVHGESTKTL